jgi:hypothetical protein
MHSSLLSLVEIWFPSLSYMFHVSVSVSVPVYLCMCERETERERERERDGLGALVPGQPCGVSLCFPPFCGFQGLNSGHQTYRATTLPTDPSTMFLQWSLLQNLEFIYLARLTAVSSQEPPFSVLFLRVEVTGVCYYALVLCARARAHTHTHTHTHTSSGLRARHFPMDPSPQLSPPPSLEIRSWHVAQVSLICPLSCPNSKAIEC